MRNIRGTIWKFGDNINTDNMSPAAYMHSVSEVAKHCLEAVRPEFCKQVKKGDIVLGGNNFGTGSSRETAPAALKELGIALIIAKSFSRLFFRNCIDIGIPVIICPKVYEQIDDGVVVSADLVSGRIIDESKQKDFVAEPLPETMMEILEAGGLIEFAIQNKW